MLKEDLPDDSPLQENVNEILSAVFRSKDMVNQILTFSRRRSGEQRPLKLEPVVKEALKLIPLKCRQSFTHASKQ